MSPYQVRKERDGRGVRGEEEVPDYLHNEKVMWQQHRTTHRGRKGQSSRREGRKWERERIRQEEEGERGRRCGMREGQREEMWYERGTEGGEGRNGRGISTMKMNSLGPWGYSHISLPQHNGELIPQQAPKFERIRHVPVVMKHECH